MRVGEWCPRKQPPPHHPSCRTEDSVRDASAAIQSLRPRTKPVPLASPHSPSPGPPSHEKQPCPTSALLHEPATETSSLTRTTSPSCQPSPDGPKPPKRHASTQKRVRPSREVDTEDQPRGSRGEPTWRALAFHSQRATNRPRTGRGPARSSGHVTGERQAASAPIDGPAPRAAPHAPCRDEPTNHHANGPPNRRVELPAGLASSGRPRPGLPLPHDHQCSTRDAHARLPRPLRPDTAELRGSLRPPVTRRREVLRHEDSDSPLRRTVNPAQAAAPVRLRSTPPRPGSSTPREPGRVPHPATHASRTPISDPWSRRAGEWPQRKGSRRTTDRLAPHVRRQRRRRVRIPVFAACGVSSRSR